MEVKETEVKNLKTDLVGQDDVEINGKNLTSAQNEKMEVRETDLKDLKIDVVVHDDVEINAKAIEDFQAKDMALKDTKLDKIKDDSNLKGAEPEKRVVENCRGDLSEDGKDFENCESDWREDGKDFESCEGNCFDDGIGTHKDPEMIKNQQGVAKENEVNRMKSNSVHNGEINVKENDLDKVESDPTNDKVRNEKSESGTLSKFATKLTDELNLIANSQSPKLTTQFDEMPAKQR